MADNVVFTNKTHVNRMYDITENQYVKTWLYVLSREISRWLQSSVTRMILRSDYKITALHAFR